MSSIISSLQHAPHLTPFANKSSTFDDVSEVELQQITTEGGSASVSLGANLAGVSAGTGTGQIAVAFASAIQAATTVDPSTGQRELKDGAGDKLTSAITALLVQNGFSSSQAGAAAANLKTELANGDPLTLSMSYDNTTQSSLSASGAYGSNAVWSAQSVTQTERSGSLNLSIDASGTLNVSLKEQTVSTAQYEGEVKGTGTLNAPVVTIALLPGQGNVPGSAALTAGDLGSGGAGPGSPSFLGFGAATQASAAQFANGTPDVFKNGFGQASANSPLTESETDTLEQASLTSVLLVNTTVTTSPGGANGSNGDQGNGQGSTDGSQSASGGQNAAASSNNGVTSGGSPSASTAATISAALKSMDDTVTQMLTDLSKTTLVASKDLPKLLENLLNLMKQGQQGANGGAQGAGNDAQGPGSQGQGAQNHGDAGKPGHSATGHPGDATGSTGSKDSTGHAHGSKPSRGDSDTSSGQAGGNTSFEIEIGFTQTISIQVVDLNGYGSTMYARPDGSLGSIVRKPTHVTA